MDTRRLITAFLIACALAMPGGAHAGPLKRLLELLKELGEGDTPVAASGVAFRLAHRRHRDRFTPVADREKEFEALFRLDDSDEVKKTWKTRWERLLLERRPTPKDRELQRVLKDAVKEFFSRPLGHSHHQLRDFVAVALSLTGSPARAEELFSAGSDSLDCPSLTRQRALEGFTRGHYPPTVQSLVKCITAADAIIEAIETMERHPKYSEPVLIEEGDPDGPVRENVPDETCVRSFLLVRNEAQKRALLCLEGIRNHKVSPATVDRLFGWFLLVVERQPASPFQMKLSPDFYGGGITR